MRLAACPLSRLAATAPPEGEPSLASPFGGRWCPVGTVQRLTEPAGESGLALARTERASCRPHHPLPWLSPLRARAPRSLVPFWLRAHKVKGKVEAFLKRKRVRPADVPQKTLRSLRSALRRSDFTLIYTMRNSGWLNSTTWPLPTQISATVPSSSAGISFISFMASMMHSVSPFFTWSPTSTKGRASGLGAE